MKNSDRHDWRMIRLIYHAVRGDTEKVKIYSRKLAEKYYRLGDNLFGDAILDAIGDIELPSSTLDEKI